MREKWNAFWFAQIDTQVYAFLRIAVGFVYILNRTGMNRLFRLQSPLPEFPDHLFRYASSYPPDSFAGSYALLTWLPAPSFDVFQLLETLALILAITWMFGLFSRWSNVLLALVSFYTFFLSQFFYHHGHFALYLAVVLLALAPTGAHYSIDAWRKGHTTLSSVLPLRLLQCHTASIFFFGGLHKLNEGWLTGRVPEVLFELGRLRGPAVMFFHLPFGAQMMGISIVFGLLFCGIGLWIPRLRRWALVLGLFLQIAIDVTYYNTLTFNYLMIALLISFVHISDITALRSVLPRSAVHERI